MGKYGKDHPENMSEEALRGKGGPSEGICDAKVGRGGQSIKSAYPMDNVSGMELPDERGGTVRGGVENLAHSLRGAQAVDAADVGAAGSVKHVIINDH